MSLISYIRQEIINPASTEIDLVGKNVLLLFSFQVMSDSFATS